MLIRKEIMKRNPLLAVSVCSLLLAACTAADIDNFFMGMGGALSTNNGSTASQCAKSDLNMRLGRANWRYLGRLGGIATISYDANSIANVDNNPNIKAIRIQEHYLVPRSTRLGVQVDRMEHITVFYCRERRYEHVRTQYFYRNRLISTDNAGNRTRHPDMSSPYYGYSNNPSCGARIRYETSNERIHQILCNN